MNSIMASLSKVSPLAKSPAQADWLQSLLFAVFRKDLQERDELKKEVVDLQAEIKENEENLENQTLQNCFQTTSNRK